MPPRASRRRTPDTGTTPVRGPAMPMQIPPFLLQTPPHAPFVSDPSVEVVNHEAAAANNTSTPPMDPNLPSDAQSPTDTEEDNPDSSQKPSAPLPPNLREISSLASWTVSTHKPGCGVAALRHPSPSQFWQSDGPQPHTLTLHFFKLVAIVRIRVYLDFELDESYTPTKMVFLAGMGGNDLVEFAMWEGESPRGWVDIDLSGVGGRDRTFTKHDTDMEETSMRKRETKARPSGATPKLGFGAAPRATLSDDDLLGDEDYDSAAGNPSVNGMAVPEGGDVLKAMVVQVRVCENHQNGKDTHVRGFQVFARDEIRKGKRERKSRGGRKDTPLEGETEEAEAEKVTGVEEADWMGEPEIR